MTDERTYRGTGGGGGGLSSAASNTSVLYSKPGAMTEGSSTVRFVPEDGLAPTGVVVEGPASTPVVDGPDGCILLADKGSFSKGFFLRDRLVADGVSFASGSFFLNVKLVRSFGIVCSGFCLGATEGPDPAAIRCFVDRLLPD
jgi:hypothetical protein